MRRAILVVLMVSGCFAEAPEPVDKIDPLPVLEESSSSFDGESSSESSSSEESSSTTEPSPYVCPDWCHNGCDEVGGIYPTCRCIFEQDCQDDLSCEREAEAPYGLCR